MPWNEPADGLSKRERNMHEKNEPTNNVPLSFQLAITTSKCYQREKVPDHNSRDRHAYLDKQDNDLIFGKTERDAQPEYMIALRGLQLSQRISRPTL
eukprot:4592263-Pyramimonas_sp.AAC.1